MCFVLRALAIVVLAFPLLSIRSALADYEAAEEAVAKQDYARAREELIKLERGTDARVFQLLAELNRDCKGGSRDFVEAYKYFSLAFMFSTDPDDRATSARLRRQIARDISEDDILAGERRVVLWIDGRLGERERRKQIKELHRALSACSGRCDDIAGNVVQYGPAAADLVPPLESLMTRDPYWMPREWYAYALAAIGTEAVPALTRVLLDKKVMAVEGFWNAGTATETLGTLGPTAFEARQSLLEALTRSFQGLGGESVRLSGASHEDAVASLKISIASTITRVADPHREIYDGLVEYLGIETEVRTKLATAWAIGLVYSETDAGFDLASQYLDDKNLERQRMSLIIIADFFKIERARSRGRELMPKVRKLTESGPESLRSLALRVLETYGH